jgi:hypothetical protein
LVDRPDSIVLQTYVLMLLYNVGGITDYVYQRLGWVGTEGAAITRKYLIPYKYSIHTYSNTNKSLAQITVSLLDGSQRPICIGISNPGSVDIARRGIGRNDRQINPSISYWVASSYESWYPSGQSYPENGLEIGLRGWRLQGTLSLFTLFWAFIVLCRKRTNCSSGNEIVGFLQTIVCER